MLMFSGSIAQNQNVWGVNSTNSNQQIYTQGNQQYNQPGYSQPQVNPYSQPMVNPGYNQGLMNAMFIQSGYNNQPQPYNQPPTYNQPPPYNQPYNQPNQPQWGQSNPNNSPWGDLSQNNGWGNFVSTSPNYNSPSYNSPPNMQGNNNINPLDVMGKLFNNPNSFQNQPQNNPYQGNPYK